MGHPRPLFRPILVFIKQTFQFPQQIYANPVYGAGIQTNDLQNMVSAHNH